MTILYMAPGGHRQWPVSIKPLLDRLSWIVLQTRLLALMHLREALHDNPDSQGTDVDLESIWCQQSLTSFLTLGQRWLLPHWGTYSQEMGHEQYSPS